MAQTRTKKEGRGGTRSGAGRPKGTGRYGEATAMATILFAIVILISLTFTRVADREVAA